MVLVRKGNIKDLEHVLKIYQEAREKFVIEKTFQWKNNYPNKETYANDLLNNIVLIAEVDGVIAGVMTIQTSADQNYENCLTVKWLNDDKYIAIHRIAVSKSFYKKGVGSALIAYAVQFADECGVKNIKVDTHEKNYDMKKLISKFGFKYCGVITLLEKNELRDAYHLVTNNKF